MPAVAAKATRAKTSRYSARPCPLSSLCRRVSAFRANLFIELSPRSFRFSFRFGGSEGSAGYLIGIYITKLPRFRIQGLRKDSPENTKVIATQLPNYPVVSLLAVENGD